MVVDEIVDDIVAALEWQRKKKHGAERQITGSNGKNNKSSHTTESDV